MKNARVQANNRVIKINKYLPATPFYCRTFFYWLFVIAGIVIDTVTLRALYDAVLNGDQRVAWITTIGVVIVLDLYSQWFPATLDYMPRKKRMLTLGISLAGIISIVAVLSVIFRISTGDVSTSNTIVQLSSSSTVMFNMILGGIPIASTLAMLFLSIQKSHWDKRNAAYVNEQILIPLRAREKELELSQGESIDLEKLDHDEYLATIELIKAYAVRAKGEARNKFASALGDSESAKELSKAVLPSHVLDSLQPSPIVDDEDDKDTCEEEE